MCAIIGQLGGKTDKEKFIQARDSMSHRGPDDRGDFYGEGVALGHCRLSIIDLSASAKQPMYSHDRRYVITFNGEIFNYVELKKELTDYPFKTESDTEVLLAAYIKWGKDCLNKLNGQFAFSIYDIKEKELFCARDHFGIKPFYYAIQDGEFLFASEIKALLKLGVPAKPDDKVIYEYLRYSYYDHSRHTFFRNISRLLPGEYAIWKDGKLITETYWSLGLLKDKEGQYDNLSKEEAIEKFKALMTDAVRFQFRSDVPVGVTLSSGLDSMSMLFFANSVVGNKIRSFSAGLDDPERNEVRVLKELLSEEQKKLLHTSLLTKEKVWPLAGKTLSAEDEPYGGLSTINYFNLYDETKIPGVTVLLEGQGADEILGGYRYYNTEKREAFSQDMTKEGAPAAINPEFATKFENEPVKFEAPFKSPLLNMQYQDLRYTKMPRVLRFNDHISLAYSKELRVPYLDKNLAEFCFFLPAKFKIDGERRKVLLRDAMKGIVPDPSKDAEKIFFGAFQTEWLRKYFKKEVYEIIESDSFKSRPYWDYKKVKELTDKFFAGEGENSFFIWQWVNLEMWLRKYIDPVRSN